MNKAELNTLRAGKEIAPNLFRIQMVPGGTDIMHGKPVSREEFPQAFRFVECDMLDMFQSLGVKITKFEVYHSICGKYYRSLMTTEGNSKSVVHIYDYTKEEQKVEEVDPAEKLKLKMDEFNDLIDQKMKQAVDAMKSGDPRILEFYVLGEGESVRHGRGVDPEEDEEAWGFASKYLKAVEEGQKCGLPMVPGDISVCRSLSGSNLVIMISIESKMCGSQIHVFEYAGKKSTKKEEA